MFRSRRVLAVLFVVVGAVALALAIAQDQNTLKLRSAVAAEDDDSPAYMAALTGSPISLGNTYRVLDNGDEIFPALLDAIARAQRRVSFETFVFEDGAVAERFIDAFADAAARGVTVNVVVDFVGGSGLFDHGLERLRKAGCHVSRYNKPEWYRFEEVNYRTHRKILVVDGEVAFTGGVGIADHWLGHAQDPDHWRDTHVEMHGPVARLLEAAFYENFVDDGGIVTPVLTPAATHPLNQEESESPRARPSTGSDAPTLVVRSSASGGSSDMKRLYLLLIASARRNLDIASPYFVSDESSEFALRDAVARGVRVRVLTEGEAHTDAKPVKYSSRRSYDRLLAAGVQIAEYQPTMLHSKVMVVDGAWSMFGSANFDNRSLELNDELNVAVHDRALAAQFLASFEADLQRAAPLDLQTWRQRPLSKKALEYFWGYWGEIF